MDHSWLTLLDARVPRYTSYPTAPHFHAGITSATVEAWLSAVDGSRPISLYLHVPFCHQLCWYCGCNTHIVKKEHPVALYVQSLLHEIDLVGRHLAVRPRVSHLHFGGGSPNRLTAAQFDTIMDRIRQHVDLLDGAEIAIEIDPRHLDAEQVSSYAAQGVNRVSLGVQDFDPQVQQAINRIQPFETVVRAVTLLRQAGIAAINVDLLYGLPRQSLTSIAPTIAQTTSLSPNRVALFGYAHVPWMKKQQKALERFGLPQAAERARLALHARERLEEHFVPIGIDHFAKADDPLALAAERHQLHRNFQGYTVDAADLLIAFGPSGIWATPQGFAQTEPDLALWHDAIAAGRLAIKRGIATDAQDRLRAAIIAQIMCHLQVDVEALALSQGTTADQFLPCFDRLAGFVAQGLVTIDGWNLTIPSRYRLAARSIAAAFDAYLDPEASRHAQAV